MPKLVVTFRACFTNAAKFSDYMLVVLYCNKLQLKHQGDCVILQYTANPALSSHGFASVISYNATSLYGIQLATFQPHTENQCHNIRNERRYLFGQDSSV